MFSFSTNFKFTILQSSRNSIAKFVFIIMSRNAFYKACKNNDIAKVTQMLDDHVTPADQLLNTINAIEEKGPLHIACELGHIRVVEILLGRDELNVF